MNRQSFDFEGPMHDIQYRYDANGNRRARIANGYTDYYAVDGRDRLWWVNRRNGEPTSGQADPYTIYNYDANGNTVYRERRHDATTLRKLALIWDSDDRLKRVWQDDGTNVTSIFNGLYDEDGLRVQKTDSWTGTHNYSWGPGGIVHDTAGTSYTPGLHQQAGGTDRFFHSDWLGSTRYLSDSAGTGLPSALRYDAFGNRSATGGTDAYHSTDFQFAGASGYQQEYASATEPGLGLQYLEQRYYDPAVGRFISPDPIGFAGGLNLYGYADGDPANEIDPTGEDWKGFVNGAKNAGRTALAGLAWFASLPGKAGTAIWNRMGRTTFQPGMMTLQNANREAYPGLAEGGKEINCFVEKQKGSMINDVFWGVVGGVAGGSVGEVAEAGGHVRVGRWMSKAEYEKMLEAGTVQESAGGITHVAFPADPMSYGPRANPGQFYVEFDVPAASLRPGGRTDWRIIPGPNSPHARLATRQGKPVPQLPAAVNIEHKATRVRF